jgi:hypothetical protein
MASVTARSALWDQQPTERRRRSAPYACQRESLAWIFFLEILNVCYRAFTALHRSRRVWRRATGSTAGEKTKNLERTLFRSRKRLLFQILLASATFRTHSGRRGTAFRPPPRQMGFERVDGAAWLRRVHGGADPDIENFEPSRYSGFWKEISVWMAATSPAMAVRSMNLAQPRPPYACSSKARYAPGRTDAARRSRETTRSETPARSKVTWEECRQPALEHRQLIRLFAAPPTSPTRRAARGKLVLVLLTRI